nr:MAG TPA: hypothetical protein [Bacteriophage sp.]
MPENAKKRLLGQLLNIKCKVLIKQSDFEKE